MGKGGVLTADRVVLVFTVEGGMSVAGADFHQSEERPRRPAHHRAGIHRGAVLVIKTVGGGLAATEVEAFPFVPQHHVAWWFEQRFKACCGPCLVIEGARKDAVVVEDGADIDHVQLFPGGAQRQHGLGQPAVQLVALLRTAHLFVVFEVVKDDQVGAVCAVAQTAQLFAATGDGDFDVVGGDHGARLPHPPFARRLREIYAQTRIGLQFNLDGLQHRISLVDRLHNQHRVMLAPGDDAIQGKKLGDEGGFGFATRRGNGVQLAFRALQDARQTVKEVAVQIALFRMARVMREIVGNKVVIARARVKDQLAACRHRLSAVVPARIVCLNIGSQRRRQRGEIFKKFGFFHASPAGLRSFSASVLTSSKNAAKLAQSCGTVSPPTVSS